MQKVFDTAFFAGLLAGLLAIGFVVAYSFPAHAQQDGRAYEAQILETYQGFLEAQNARDLEKVGSFFIDGPDFLWVSDGMSFWGREATLARMANFQKSEVWKVHPDLSKARVVTLGDGSAMLHFPLILEIGKAAEPSHLGFLVSALFVRRGENWRIAALLTTAAK